MVRDRLRLLVVAVLVAGIGVLLWWLGLPAPEGPAVAQPLAGADAPAEPPPTRLDALGRLVESVVTQTSTVTWLVQDLERQPITGVEIELWSGHRGVSDDDGRIVMDSVPYGNGSYQPTVHGPWLVMEGSSDGWIDGVAQTRLLVLSPTCPGLVRLRDEDGEPVADATLYLNTHRGPWGRPGMQQDSLRTDRRGEAHAEYRPCGTITATVSHEPSGYLPWLEVEVRGQEPLDLTLPAMSDVILAVVGADGALVDASIDSNKAYGVERIGVGLFIIEGRRAWATVTATAPGYPNQTHRVLLDGGEHSLTLAGGREVAVTVLCDERCPEELQCSRNPCEAEDDELWRCVCQQGGASLINPNGRYLGEIPAGAAAHTVDLRTDVTVRGRWTGTLPCHVAAEHGPHMGAPCKPDGRFEIEDVRPGPNTITVRHGLEEVGSTQVELVSGETVDVGSIDPSSWTIDGVIAADFPHEAALLFSSPTADVDLELDGGFVLRGVPAEADSLALRLWVPARGMFEETFAVPASGSLPTWHITQADIADTEPLEPDYRPLLEDTGWDWDDTGLGGWLDTGLGGDSGWWP